MKLKYAKKGFVLIHLMNQKIKLPFFAIKYSTNQAVNGICER